MRGKGNFELVKAYLDDMDMAITEEDVENELVVVDNEDEGIKSMIIDCEEPIVIIEQLIMKVRPDDADFFKRLLQMNRELVHGAFVLDETGEMLLFRDTLQLENLDYNELEGSVKSLSLAMSEYGAELLTHAAV
ncbi:molecular chaperone Tir [Desulfonema ishimotonii]|uniref:Molecular chaperone Tir n=1 Tax=Desulfonema ishimotonii TaxID=45657 RepID=A0A401FW69_9BACT|nr:YbjN domain-containing protein [Desulfonema ishimotonii]GBC61232.1 molecular chaperone Tir [Desulfonema ishimotonii]